MRFQILFILYLSLPCLSFCQDSLSVKTSNCGLQFNWAKIFDNLATKSNSGFILSGTFLYERDILDRVYISTGLDVSYTTTSINTTRIKRDKNNNVISEKIKGVIDYNNLFLTIPIEVHFAYLLHPKVFISLGSYLQYEVFSDGEFAFDKTLYVDPISHMPLNTPIVSNHNDQVDLINLGFGIIGGFGIETKLNQWNYLAVKLQYRAGKLDFDNNIRVARHQLFVGILYKFLKIYKNKNNE